MSGRLRALSSRLLTNAQKEYLVGMSLFELEEWLSESEYGPLWRQLRFQWQSKSPFIDAINLVRASRLNEMVVQAQGQAALAALVLCLLSDITCGLKALASWACNVDVNYKDAFGPWDAASWESLKVNQLEEQKGPVPYALLRSRTEGLAPLCGAQRTYCQCLLDWGHSVVAHMGRPHTLMTYLGGLADEVNFRLWRTKYFTGLTVEPLEVPSSLTERVVTAQSYKAFFAGTVYERQIEEQGDVAQQIRDYWLKSMVKESRQDPIGVGLMASVFARVIIERDFLANLYAKSGGALRHEL